MFSVMMASSNTQAQKDIVDRPGILAKAKGSVNLLCKAPAGESDLSLCLWGMNVKRRREVSFLIGSVKLRLTAGRIILFGYGYVPTRPEK